MTDVAQQTNITSGEVRRKLLLLEKELNSIFVQRQEVIRGLMLGLLSRNHTLLLGRPGTAKSALIEKLSEAMQVRMFSRLITEYSTPDELFGPLDLSALEKGIFRRVIGGKAADSELVFLDEVFKGSSSILNTLLRLMQERIFDNDGTVTQTPLMLMVGASNELPEEGSGLEAFYDRFLLRFWVNGIEDDYSLRQMLQTDLAASVTTINKNEIEFAQQEINVMTKTKFGAEAADSIVMMWQKLKFEHSIHPSDRRIVALKSVMAADSWLAGNQVVMPESIGVAADILWNKLEDQGKVSQLAIASVNPYRAEANQIISAAKTAVNELLRSDKPDTAEATSVIGTLRDMKEDMEKLERKAKGRQKEPLEAALKEIEALNRRAVSEGLGITI